MAAAPTAAITKAPLPVIFIITSDPPSNREAERIRIRCPNCRDRVTLDSFKADSLSSVASGGEAVFGQRICPHCRAHVFVAYARPQNVLVTYPAETIDFDSSDVPDAVREAMEEAIKCHAQQCFVAGAIMVRKTLEEVCKDRGANGGNLKERVAGLRDKIVLPEPMFVALDNLRLLGNDATHVESRVFNQVGKDELEVAIDVTKEVLKATYQYESLMGRLEALKRPRD